MLDQLVDVPLIPGRKFVYALIFNSYFGGKWPMLPDISYFSTEDKVYQFTVRPPECLKGS